MTDTPGSQDPAPTPSRAGRNLPAALASGVVLAVQLHSRHRAWAWGAPASAAA